MSQSQVKAHGRFASGCSSCADTQNEEGPCHRGAQRTNNLPLLQDFPARRMASHATHRHCKQETMGAFNAIVAACHAGSRGSGGFCQIKNRAAVALRRTTPVVRRKKPSFRLLSATHLRFAHEKDMNILIFKVSFVLRKTVVRGLSFKYISINVAAFLLVSIAFPILGLLHEWLCLQ